MIYARTRTQNRFSIIFPKSLALKYKILFKCYVSINIHYTVRLDTSIKNCILNFPSLNQILNLRTYI